MVVDSVSKSELSVRALPGFGCNFRRRGSLRRHPSTFNLRSKQEPTVKDATASQQRINPGPVCKGKFAAHFDILVDDVVIIVQHAVSTGILHRSAWKSWALVHGTISVSMAAPSVTANKTEIWGTCLNPGVGFGYEWGAFPPDTVQQTSTFCSYLPPLMTWI